jgi:flagellar biosynthesis protein FlhG
MVDQADKLRQLLRTARPAVRADWSKLPMVAVTGGRSGVGTTTVAVNTGAALADFGHRVLVVDASQHLNDMPDVAGIRRVEKSLADVVAGKSSVMDTAVSGPVGMQLLFGSPRRTAAEFNRHTEQQLLAALDTVSDRFDVVVIETGTGLSPWLRRIWRRSRLAIVVTTADQSALLDTYATLKLGFDDPLQANVGVVINQAASDSIANDMQRRVANSCQRFLSLDVAALPSLPDAAMHALGTGTKPRLWEQPDSPFGHAALWLGRAVSDLLGVEDAGGREQGEKHCSSNTLHPAPCILHPGKTAV